MISDEALDLVPLRALMSAIARRYQAWVFVATNQRGDGRDSILCNFDGPTFVQLGLLAHAQAMITSQQIGRIVRDPEAASG